MTTHNRPHTATSGGNSTPDGRFDCGISVPVAALDHTFKEAGKSINNSLYIQTWSEQSVSRPIHLISC